MNNTKKDYGFLLIKIDQRYKGLINSISDIANHRPYDQTCIFNSNHIDLPVDDLPILHLNEMKYFFGNLFVFDIAGLILSQECPNIHNRYYYAVDAPWIDNTKAFYREWKNLFEQDNLEIIAQNKHVADIYEICWKKPILVTEEFSYDTISKII